MIKFPTTIYLSEKTKEGLKLFCVRKRTNMSRLVEQLIKKEIGRN